MQHEAPRHLAASVALVVLAAHAWLPMAARMYVALAALVVLANAWRHLAALVALVNA